MSAIAGIIANAPQPQLQAWLSAILGGMSEYRSLGPEQLTYSPGAAFGSIGENASTWQAESLLCASAQRLTASDLRLLSDQFRLPQQPPQWQSILPPLYYKMGDHLGSALYGDFALAVWNPAKHQLLLTRDSSGIKPLFYALLPQQNGIAFASSVKALLALPILRPEVDLDEIAKKLVYNGNSSLRKTHFKNIHILPPGSSVSFENDILRENTFWKFDAIAPIRYKDPRDYQANFDPLLTNAVSERVDPTKTNGSHISGGADSTTVTLIAQQALRQQNNAPLLGYTWSPPAAPQDLTGELRVLRSIEEKFNLPIRYCDLTAQEVQQVFSRNFLSEPTETLQSEFNILKKAQADGVRIMLSGWGGDEVVSANPAGYIAGLFLRMEWARLIRLTGGYRSPTRFIKMLRNIHHNLKIMSGGEFPFHQVFNERKQLLYGLTQGPLRQAVQQVRPKTLPKPSFRYFQKHLWEHGHLFHRISDWDRHGAAFGLEYRYPLLDRRLLEYIIAIPFEVNFPYPTRGKLIRQTLAGFIGQDQAFGRIKLEDYRQPIFQQTIVDGARLCAEAITTPDRLQNPYIHAENLFEALKNHTFSTEDYWNNRILRELINISQVNFNEYDALP